MEGKWREEKEGIEDNERIYKERQKETVFLLSSWEAGKRQRRNGKRKERK